MVQIMSTMAVTPGGGPQLFCKEIWRIEYSCSAYTSKYYCYLLNTKDNEDRAVHYHGQDAMVTWW